ncbi:fused uroporphyrinogen-III synthase HemD/membrane protein HemX [Cupriavidus oxalaticus]|uniref:BIFUNCTIONAL: UROPORPHYRIN-III C-METHYLTRANSFERASE AND UROPORPHYRINOGEN-III SYNTHASE TRANSMEMBRANE PROTEIN n=1 Tax=Cupriavidus oxalaticus TaxID=96344 RepID=A0A375FW55_9BURK|nr:fused uroporphyrinogen-III synthase HemD/membrane protein HemX [Cupriavidus oxalaticus]QRQ88129.1 fused uroporphyrinogen-III synthase HemD/membrane protein HemX [Cupriavidus oxalaticus]QRQ93545.1 fused uroporphyrinogen-III synthase HemD/membrane protein HemX [Cupriavidus oxalaticus]WQD82173.1 fused uroporphyrinogen-III synthase HemD/membrane protein HemX [Cupriavidus oxalaticus]SPC08511.1 BIFUNCTIONAL: UROPORPHYRIN-III C-METHYLTRANSFERASE AND UROPORPHYRINOGEN-III SYNTHASE TRANSMEMBRANE PROTE
MPRPTVVVTRPAGQSRQLTEALQAAGLDVLSFPLLAIGPAADDAPLRAALARLDQFALVVFVSPNAIAHALDALAGVQGAATAQWPAQVPAAVVGPASVAALAERGIAPPTCRVIAPAGAAMNGQGADDAGESGNHNHDPSHDTNHDHDGPRFDSEALWAQLDPAALAGKPVLIVRGNGGRDWLGDRLREAGAQVEAVEAYRRTLPEPGAMQWQAVRDSLQAGAPPYAWLLTSSEAVRNLDTLARQHLSPQENAGLRQVQCIAPHARIAEQALALGFSHILRAAPGDAGLLAACLQWADAHAGPAPAPVAAVPDAAGASGASGRASAITDTSSARAEAPAPAVAVPATSTKVERVTQETTSSSATPPPAAASTPAPGPGTSAAAAGHAAAARKPAALWALVAVLVVATAGGFWWLQQRVDHLTGELARRQQSNDALVQESRVLTRNAQDTVKELQAKVGVLENQVGETRDKQVALEQVYQDLMRNRDDWEIAEIQQLLTNAGQQLQLTGNVQVALAALQSADARLARTDKPQYNLLRRAIARDIARMKAVPDTDLTGAAIKLDEAINQVDALPLLSSERMLERTEADARKDGAAGKDAASVPAAAAAANGWFSRLWTYLREEMAQVVRIRKVDDAEALLLSGDQGWFLRENVKLRLLNARLALLSRNEPVFRNDLAAAQAMIGRYFDSKSRRVQGVLTLLRQAQAGAVTVQLPTMSESLGALRALKKE